MRCVAYCTAAAYDLSALNRILYDLSPNCSVARHGEILHLQIEGEDLDDLKHIYYFSYGAVVFWGGEERERLRYLKDLEAVQKAPLQKIEEDHFTLSKGDKVCVVKDEIILASDDSFSLLAVSHAIAQSVKLESFENSLERIIDLTEWIPETLARTGKIPLSRRETQKMIGRLVIERNSINIQSDVLDTPEFFWKNVELKPLYNMLARYLALEDRVEVLNQRLDIVHDLFEMLSNELNHQHTSRLEWTIILLIVFEVVLTLLKDVFHVI